MARPTSVPKPEVPSFHEEDDDASGEVPGPPSLAAVGLRDVDLAASRTPEELTRAAWRALDEFTKCGKITLPNGKVLIPDSEDPTCKLALDTFKWMAQLQGKPKKTPKAMDDWKPQETRS